MTLGSSIKGLVVIVGTIGVSAYALHAGDKLWWKEGVCPHDMVEVTNVLGLTCVDQFEAGAGPACPIRDPQNTGETQTNMAMPSCKAVGDQDGMPWRYINRDDAMKVCANAGKRLPSSDEWYQLALSVRPETCNLALLDIAKAGDFADCANHDGVMHLVGNVWEWVKDDVRDGVMNGQNLPASGYITQVDSHGVAVTTDEKNASDSLGKDYFWSKTPGIFAVLRGGFYGAHEDGGIYSMQANTSPQFTGAGVGFRCVK
jgi:formylglycine-generating enzyme required for sulfatase activity